MSPALRLGLLVATICTAVPSSADAHGLAGRADLPIPEWMFAWAATAVLVVSFVALGALWRSPRLENAGARRVLTIPRAVELICGVLGVAAFVVLIYAGLAGSQSPTANALPTAVY